MQEILCELFQDLSQSQFIDLPKANQPSHLDPNALKHTLPVDHLLEFILDLMLALKPKVKLAILDDFLNGVHFRDQVRIELLYIKLRAQVLLITIKGFMFEQILFILSADLAHCFIIFRVCLFGDLRDSPCTRLSIFLGFLTYHLIIQSVCHDIAVLGTKSYVRHACLRKDRAQLISLNGARTRVADRRVFRYVTNFINGRCILAFFLFAFFALIGVILPIFLSSASKLVLQANKFVYKLVLLCLEEVVNPVNLVQIRVYPLHCQLFCLSDGFIFFDGRLHVLQVSLAQFSWCNTLLLNDTQFLR